MTFFKKFSNCLKHSKTLFVSRPTVAWPQPQSRDRSATFFKNSSNCLIPRKTVVWQSVDGRVSSDLVGSSKKCCLKVSGLSRDGPALLFPCFFFVRLHILVTVQRLFSKNFLIAWNIQTTLFDSRPTVAWPPTTLAWPFSDFFKIFSNCLKRPKNVVWQSADRRVTSTTVTWPFSDFFQNSPKSIGTSKKRCLTVGRRSRDLRPLSRDRSATFYKKISNCLKRRKNVVWQSADSRVTSNHCRVTVQRLFSKILPIAWYLEKQLFDSRPTVASYPTWMESRTNFVWKSSDCHVTVRLLCSRGFFFVRLHILPRRCISRSYFSSIFPPKARPRISSYRNGPILEISTSYQS